MCSRCLQSVCAGIGCYFSLRKSDEWAGWKKKTVTGVSFQTASTLSVCVKNFKVADKLNQCRVWSCCGRGHSTTWVYSLCSDGGEGVYTWKSIMMSRWLPCCYTQDHITQILFSRLCFRGASYIQAWSKVSTFSDTNLDCSTFCCVL